MMYEDSDDEIPSVKAMSEEIKILDVKIAEALEGQLSAERQLRTLDTHANGVTGENWSAEGIVEVLQTYDEERRKLFAIHAKAIVELKDLQKRVDRKTSERTKLGRAEEKRKHKVQKEKQKQKLQKMS